MAKVNKEQRFTTFLRQRLSVVVQRGNAASILVLFVRIIRKRTREEKFYYNNKNNIYYFSKGPRE